MSDYTAAIWIGISVETSKNFDKGGPDTSLVTNDWLQEHIRLDILESIYPNLTHIMEGDTPSYFPLIRNSLGDPEHPEWGSCGADTVLSICPAIFLRIATPRIWPSVSTVRHTSAGSPAPGDGVRLTNSISRPA